MALNQLPEDCESMSTLSIVIIAKNEERTIGKVLCSVRAIADEIILVDSGSSDATKEIANQFGARVVHQDWLGYSGQKNFAIDLARSDWILSLDADEIVTDALAREIKESIVTPGTITGYRIPRVLYIGTTAVRKGGFYPDAQLRLFKRGHGKFRPRAVHEAVSVDGTVALLKHDIHHYAYESVEEFAQAMETYARLSASHYFETGYSAWRASWGNELLNPIWTLIYRQVARGGYLGGQLCWRLNLIYSHYVRKKVKYLRELVHTAKGNAKSYSGKGPKHSDSPLCQTSTSTKQRR